MAWFRKTLRRKLPLFASLLAPLLASPGAAKDFVLTIGGGYSPLGNQVSIERNVLFFRQTIADRLPAARHDILFSDGRSPGRDVQIRTPEPAEPTAWKLLAQVFQQEKNWGLEYRTHQVPDVLGAATVENISHWFDELATRTGAGDRVIVYVTAHGGKSTGADAQNTELYLWNNQRLSASAFSQELDKLPAQVDVVLVMVQCHAGGFANVLFDKANAARGMSPAHRCGFFATLYDRPAAGCTPDVQTENDQEYSSFFWAALGGKDRAGMASVSVDYDNDGATSFADAHTYAAIHSRSVDIPLRTSEVFLRYISPSTSDNPVGPYSLSTPYGQLLLIASPHDRALVEGLSNELGIGGADRVKAARELAADALARRDGLETRQAEVAAQLQQSSQLIRVALTNRWPELANPWTPAVAALVNDQGDAIRREIEQHAQFAKFQAQHQEFERLVAERLDQNRRWSKSQRLLRGLENIALAANLPAVASSESQAKYRDLLTLENQSFASPAMRSANNLR
jgi:hypothetical protein